jgi:hypothetical protein
LRKLQAGGISLIETNIEWKKYDYRAYTEKLLCKTFGSTRIAYSTSDEQVEESRYKPGGMATAALGHWASRVLRSGKDLTGCGRWSYTCIGKNDKKFANLRTQFEVDLAMAVVEHKMPELRSGETCMEFDKDVLVQKELKSRENRRTDKRSWQKLGRKIRGHLKPHTLQKSKLTAVEIPGADDGSWLRIDTKEQVEELLINRNIEQFSHAGDTPFGYTPLGEELGHTGDTRMADDIYNGTLEHISLTDHAIKSIVKQLRKYPLLTTILYPEVKTEDFISCFGCIAEQTSSPPPVDMLGTI